MRNVFIIDYTNLILILKRMLENQPRQSQHTEACTLRQFRKRTTDNHQILTTSTLKGRAQQSESANLHQSIFDSLAALPQSGCKQHLLKQRKAINDYFAEIELQILRQFGRWKLKQLNKLDCLIDFFDKAKLSSIFKVPKDVRGQLQAEHIEFIQILQGISKRQKKEGGQYFSTLVEEFAQILKNSYKKGNNSIELFKQMLASNQYDSIDLGDEGYQAKVQSKTNNLKTKLRNQFNKLKDITEIVSSQESQKKIRMTTVPFCNIENEHKQQERQSKDVFSIYWNENMSKSMENPSLSKSGLFEEVALKNDQLSNRMTNISRRRHIQKKEVHTRINYGKRHYPIQINEDLETQRMKALFQRNNLKGRKDNINKQDIPHGLQLRGNVLVIWNGKRRTQIMNFLFLNQQVKYLVINDKTLATRQQINKMLKLNQSIQGIDLNCENSIQLRYFTPSRLKFLNCFKNFRFMKESDTVKYFPWKKQTIRSHADETLQTIKSYQLQSFTVTVSQQLANMPQKLKELNFCQLQDDQQLTLNLNSKIIMNRVNCLQILSFSNVTFTNFSYNFLKNLFINNQNIKNLAISHCFLQFNKVIASFDHLNRATLRQLLLEANECEPKEVLNQKSCQIISSFPYLQVLIIVNFQFVNRRNELEQISGFCEIRALTNLNHLNLYNSQPIFSDFLQYLDPSTYQNMRTFNLGLTKIDSSAVGGLSKFAGLQALVLDYTSISGKDLVEITKDMRNLRKLSLQKPKQFYNFEERGNNSLQVNSQDLVKCQDFESFTHKTLEYVNIGGCARLKDYQWSSFIRLKIIRSNNSQLSSEVKNRLSLLKIQLFQEQKGLSCGMSNLHFPDGKRQGSEKLKETNKLQDIQQILYNSSRKTLKPNNLTRFNQLLSHRKSQRLKKSKTSVNTRGCILCDSPQPFKPRTRTTKTAKNAVKVKYQAEEWEERGAGNYEIRKVKVEEGKL